MIINLAWSYRHVSDWAHG